MTTDETGETSERRDRQGRLIAPLTASTDLYALRRAGELLDAQPGTQAKDRFTSAEIRFWDYQVRGVAVSLQWERDVGLSLLAGDASPEVERRVRELAATLRAGLAASQIG